MVLTAFLLSPAHHAALLPLLKRWPASLYSVPALTEATVHRCAPPPSNLPVPSASCLARRPCLGSPFLQALLQVTVDPSGCASALAAVPQAHQVLPVHLSSCSGCVGAG